MDDRSLQLEILKHLDAVFPEWLVCEEMPGYNLENFNECMFYLSGHGLIDGEESKELGVPRQFFTAQITVKGKDFLKDDGGLSAILGIVTVKLHADTIKSLIESKIDSSPLPKEEKSLLRSALKAAPAAVVGELSKRLVALALDQAPGVFQLLQSILHGGT